MRSCSMFNAEHINEIYNFLEQGVVFKSVQNELKVLLSKSCPEPLRFKLRSFVADNKSFIVDLLNRNHQELSAEKTNIINTGLALSPLSFAQERLWFIERYEGGTAAYNVPLLYHLPNNFDENALCRSVNEIINRHEVLRSLIKEDLEGNGYQERLESFDLPVERFSVIDEHQLMTEVGFRIDKPFDLANELPIRMSLIQKLSNNNAYLFIIVHHIAFDGWSADILLKELQCFYRYYEEGIEGELPLLDIQYSDFSIWQRHYLQGNRLAEPLNFWRSQLLEYQPLNLIADKKRPLKTDYSGADIEFEVDVHISNGLKQIAKICGVSLYSVMLSAYFILLKIYSGQNDLVVGSPIANRQQPQLDQVIGLTINSIVLRAQYVPNQSLKSFIQQVGELSIAAQCQQSLPFERLVSDLQVTRDTSRHPIFQVMFGVQNFGDSLIAGAKITTCKTGWQQRYAKFDLSTFINDSGPILQGYFNFATALFESETILRFIHTYRFILEQFVQTLENQSFNSKRLSALQLLDQQDWQTVICDWNNTNMAYPENENIVSLFEAQVARQLDNVALVSQEEVLTYRELNENVDRVAAHLLTSYQLQANDLVCLCLSRTKWLVICLFAVLKAGAAYVPLDPDYPDERIQFILKDTKAKLILISGEQEQRFLDLTQKLEIESTLLNVVPLLLTEAEKPVSFPVLKPRDLAYVIYTSGSTGLPKGVMVTHHNLVNFFTTQDSLVTQGAWLAVTNVTFDIAGLELIGSLLYGFKLILGPSGQQMLAQGGEQSIVQNIEFSLFYFGNYDSESENTGEYYTLLLEGAKYADQQGFSAVWTPERHFDSFGGLYPNPAITSAAIASVTCNIEVRSGSCVLPLHNPIRVAEDWALVDRLSNGRAGMALATGWHENDFILAPEKYQTRKNILFEGMQLLKKLWRGETVEAINPKGQRISAAIFPKPIRGELPLWLTTGGNPESFEQAGVMGVNLLTHLLGQSIEELAEKIATYRKAYQQGGYDLDQCKVTLMLHTFVSKDEEEVLRQVKAPFKAYLKTALHLLKKQLGQEDLESLTPDEMDLLLEKAFTRYFNTSGLFGTPSSCLSFINRLKSIGVNEIACLIDFGIDPKVVFDNLCYLKELMQHSAHGFFGANNFSDLVRSHQITHLQCTPPFAELAIEYSGSLDSVRYLLIGGEVLTSELANKLQKKAPNAAIFNMYGPTEATIWATSERFSVNRKQVTIGKPLANVKAYILNEVLMPCGVGMVGELHLSGAGIAEGYLNQAELTAQRFIQNPFCKEQKFLRLYKTGDLCRYLSDGRIEFLGRIDNQVKHNGYRIELEEVSTTLQQHPMIKQAVTIIRDKRLVSYYTSEVLIKQEELRLFLQKSLPSYMLPSHFVLIETMPLTPNGKLAINQLPRLEARNLDSTRVAPNTPLEFIIANTFAEVLEISVIEIGVDDDFFSLGGDSIMAIRLARKLSHFMKREVALSLIFENMSVGRLASCIDKEQQRVDKGEEVEF